MSCSSSPLVACVMMHVDSILPHGQRMRQQSNIFPNISIINRKHYDITMECLASCKSVCIHFINISAIILKTVYCVHNSSSRLRTQSNIISNTFCMQESRQIFFCPPKRGGIKTSTFINKIIIKASFRLKYLKSTTFYTKFSTHIL